MAELELPRITLRRTIHGAPNLSRPPSQNTTGRNTPTGGGQNAAEAILIGSSDEEDEGPAPPWRLTPARSTPEQRARLHRNRRGTPIPRASEDGLRIMSPPPVPPLPGNWHFPMPQDPPGVARPWFPDRHLPFLSAHEFTPHILRQLARPDRLQLLRILHQDNAGIPFGSLMEMLGFPPERPPQPEEYSVRMTHASAKPRIGYTFDFAPDEEAEETPTAQTRPATPPPQVRTRTTIIIPDSPPTRPVDHKGKGRARDEDFDRDVMVLNSDPEAPIDLVSSPAAPSSSSRPRRKPRQREAVEIVEFLSDDELDDGSQHPSGSHASASSVASSSHTAQPEKIQTVLVCGSCRRPLRTGGDKLWALRCGHMIDSRCYRKFAEEPTEAEQDKGVVTLNNGETLGESSGTAAVEGRTTRGSKRRRTTRNTKGKGKGKGPAPAPTPQVIETFQWICPVVQCGRVHKSERVVNGGVSLWQPAKEDGAIKVFI